MPKFCPLSLAHVTSILHLNQCINNFFSSLNLSSMLKKSLSSITSLVFQKFHLEKTSEKNSLGKAGGEGGGRGEPHLPWHLQSSSHHNINHTPRRSRKLLPQLQRWSGFPTLCVHLESLLLSFIQLKGRNWKTGISTHFHPLTHHDLNHYDMHRSCPLHMLTGSRNHTMPRQLHFHKFLQNHGATALPQLVPSTAV